MKKSALCMLLAIFIFTPSLSTLGHCDEMRQGGKGGKFAKIDTNGDGKIDLNEFQASGMKRREANFKTIDTNGDGFLTKEELRAARKNRKQK